MSAAAGDALPFPIFGGRYRVTFPILDADGDLVTAPGSLDSEISEDGGTFADAANEATEIATGSGMFFLNIEETETNNSTTAIIVKSTAGKTTPIVLYPRRYAVYRTGTAQAGAAGTITLDASASDIDGFYEGCIIQCLNDVPSGVIGQTRFITVYVGSTKVATINADWGTNPSSSTTFEIYIPEGRSGVENIPERGQKTPNAATTLEEILSYLWMLARNDNEATTTERRIKNDGGTVIAKATMADSGSVFNQGELATGP